jgi:hypothetical protein
LMEEVRNRIENDTFGEWYPGMVEQLEQKI